MSFTMCADLNLDQSEPTFTLRNTVASSMTIDLNTEDFFIEELHERGMSDEMIKQRLNYQIDEVMRHMMKQLPSGPKELRVDLTFTNNIEYLAIGFKEQLAKHIPSMHDLEVFTLNFRDMGEPYDISPDDNAQFFDAMINLLDAIPHPEKLKVLNLILHNMVTHTRDPDVPQESLPISQSERSLGEFLSRLNQLESFSITGNWCSEYVQDIPALLENFQNLTRLSMDFSGNTPQTLHTINELLSKNKKLSTLKINFTEQVDDQEDLTQDDLAQEDLINMLLNIEEKYHKRPHIPFIEKARRFGELIQKHPTLETCSIDLTFMGNRARLEEMDIYTVLLTHIAEPISKNKTITKLYLGQVLQDLDAYQIDYDNKFTVFQQNVLKHFGENNFKVKELSVQPFSHHGNRSEAEVSLKEQAQSITQRNIRIKNNLLGVAHDLISKKSLAVKQARQWLSENIQTPAKKLKVDYLLTLHLINEVIRIQQNKPVVPANKNLIFHMLEAVFSNLEHINQLPRDCIGSVALHLDCHDLLNVLRVGKQGFFEVQKKIPSISAENSAVPKYSL